VYVICISIRISLSAFLVPGPLAYVALGSDLNLRSVAADVEDPFARTNELFGVHAHLLALFIDAPKSVATRRDDHDDDDAHRIRRVSILSRQPRRRYVDNTDKSERPRAPCIRHAPLPGREGEKRDLFTVSVCAVRIYTKLPIIIIISIMHAEISLSAVRFS